MLGLIIFNLQQGIPGWLLFIVGAFALIGSGLVSYTSARAESLGIGLGNPTLASKGTRTTLIAISGILSGFLVYTPTIALFYLVLHTNLTVLRRIRLAYQSVAPTKPLM